MIEEIVWVVCFIAKSTDEQRQNDRHTVTAGTCPTKRTTLGIEVKATLPFTLSRTTSAADRQIMQHTCKRTGLLPRPWLAPSLGHLTQLEIETFGAYPVQCRSCLLTGKLRHQA